jgi:hypothetical protein
MFNLVWVFSPLLVRATAATGQKRCRIKGLSAELRVIYQEKPLDRSTI